MTSRGPILVLDDDPDLLELVRRALEHEGWRVVTAPDAETAFAAFERERPCLMFVDLMLPHVDGESFLEQLRGRWGQIPPVVLLTASEARVRVAERLEADATLAKPFDLADVRALARAHCG